jgi:hypothetical protein
MDFEFLEGTQTKRFLGLPIGQGWKIFDEPYRQTKPTIDLISIGVVSEDNREYYAISKDFNLKEAWNRFDIKKGVTKPKYMWDSKIKENEKEYWIRENILKPIFVELFIKDGDLNKEMCLEEQNKKVIESKMTYSWLKNLLNKYGKTNKQIAKEVLDFCRPNSRKAYQLGVDYVIEPVDFPEFYGYYADYDWVAFCWLFGKMIDLPSGFPMMAYDLKQEFDRIENFYRGIRFTDYSLRILEKAGKTISSIKELPNYPKQTNSHNALADARWNKELYEFLKQLK